MITVLLHPLAARLTAAGWTVDQRVHWRLEARRGSHHVMIGICPNTFLWRATYGRIEGIGVHKGWADRRATANHETPEGAFDALGEIG